MNTNNFYLIHVKGHLDERWLRWFEGLTVEHLDNGETRVSGTLVDQAALFGVLSRIRDLGLDLLSVQRDAADTEGNHSQT